VYSSIANIATCLRLDVQGLNLRVAIFSAPVQTGPRAHLASYTIGTGSFLWVKCLGCDISHLDSSSAKVIPVGKCLGRDISHLDSSSAKVKEQSSVS